MTIKEKKSVIIFLVISFIIFIISFIYLNSQEEILKQKQNKLDNAMKIMKTNYQKSKDN